MLPNTPMPSIAKCDLMAVPVAVRVEHIRSVEPLRMPVFRPKTFRFPVIFQQLCFICRVPRTTVHAKPNTGESNRNDYAIAFVRASASLPTSARTSAAFEVMGPVWRASTSSHVPRSSTTAGPDELVSDLASWMVAWVIAIRRSSLAPVFELGSATRNANNSCRECLAP